MGFGDRKDILLTSSYVIVYSGLKKINDENVTKKYF